MNKRALLKGRDVISGSLAECYLKIKDRRYNFMSGLDFEGSFEKTVSQVPILGRTGKANKTTGWSGKYKMKVHYNTSIMRMLLLHYKDTGEDTYFEIQVTNEDPTSAIGRQTVIFIDCLANGGVLSKFDAKSEYLDEEIEGTFDDFKIPEEFTLLEGM